MHVETLAPPSGFSDACRLLGFPLSQEEVDRLGRYLALLLETNKQFNLTAVRDPEAAWYRHILDSLSILPYIGHSQHDKPALKWIDVGSGGGLPGIPLAIARPDLSVTLLEATGKKARFLEQAAHELNLTNVRIVSERAETIGRDKLHRECYDAAVARAIGPLRVMLEFTLPLVHVGGRVLAMKGAKVQQELDEAGDALTLLGAGEVRMHEAMPGLEDDAVIVEIVKEHPTPREYPRLPGEPKTHPL